jgi:pyruvate/2-oxoglutarate/acetoin dehydrogenase E1 component
MHKKNPKNKNRYIQYSDAINEALIQSMKLDKKVVIMGLGVDDPKRIFGSTKNLIEIFGNKRVFDMPTSENAITGFAIGMSLGKYKPVICHQRVEFALLSMDQIINQAAKWFYMNDGQMSVPIVIRLIIGRGWGQGPQHSQSLETLFANIPGLKVVCPSSAHDAKGMLISSINDKNPIIFFEHRWLHSTHSKVPNKYYTVPIGRSKITKKGSDITIVSSSYMSIETLKAAEILKKYKVDAEIIDLRTLRPLDIKPVVRSVKKTKKLLVVDNGWTQFGISSEIISRIATVKNLNKDLIIMRIGIADTPIPSTRKLAKLCYPDCIDICMEVEKILNLKFKNLSLKFNNYRAQDIPNKNFTGPF